MTDNVNDMLNFLVDVERKFIQDWTLKEKCPCVKELTANTVLNCKHVRDSFNDITKEYKKLLWNKTVERIGEENPDIQKLTERMRYD